MPARYRTREKPTTGVSYRTPYDSSGNPLPSIAYPQTWFQTKEECYDVSPGYGMDNSFSLSSFEDQTVPITGARKDIWGNKFWEFYGARPTYTRGYDITPLPTKTLSDSAIINRMNPSKPSVDLPLFLYELKDLPGMAKAALSFARSVPKAIELIRVAGLRAIFQSRNFNTRKKDDWLNNYADFHLQGSFGYGPILSDLIDMMNLGEAVRRRREEQVKLRRGGLLRKKIVIGENSSSSQDAPNSFMGELHGQIYLFGYAISTKNTRQWATSAWQHSEARPLRTQDQDWEALKSVLGLNLSFESLWNALPWSFMIDYFTDIGDYLGTMRNSAEIHFVTASKMTMTKSSTNIVVTNIIDRFVGTGGGGSMTYTNKARTPIGGGLLLPAFTPFLSVEQVSNLASLSVASRKIWR